MFEPLITREDIQQEAFLRSLEKGKPVSRSIIRKKLERESTSQLNYEEVMDPERDMDLPDDRDLTASEELKLWAQEMSREVQSVIDEFLNDPDKLEDTMAFLARQGLIQELLDSRPSAIKKMNYTTMMKRALPATKDELIVMVTRAGTMERPAATVRAFLRRFKSNLTTDTVGKIHWRN